MKREIVIGELDASLLDAAVEIFMEAFWTKLKVLVRDRRTADAIVKASIDTESGIYAIDDGVLTGLLGLETRTHSFFHVSYQTIRSYFGVINSAVIWLILNFELRVREGELKIESLAVAGQARGSGTGTLLVQTAERYARDNGCTILSLDVINTNDGARRLYERLGFSVVRTSYYGFITRRAGFTASHYMQKVLPPADGQELNEV